MIKVKQREEEELCNQIRTSLQEIAPTQIWEGLIQSRSVELSGVLIEISTRLLLKRNFPRLALIGLWKQMEH